MLSFNFGGAVKKQKDEGVFIPGKRIGSKNEGVKSGVRLFIILLLWAAAAIIIISIERKILMDLLTWKSWAVN